MMVDLLFFKWFCFWVSFWVSLLAIDVKWGEMPNGLPFGLLCGLPFGPLAREMSKARFWTPFW